MRGCRTGAGDQAGAGTGRPSPRATQPNPMAGRPVSSRVVALARKESTVALTRQLNPALLVDAMVGRTEECPCMNCGAELIRSLATSSPIPEGPDSDGTSGPSLFDSLGSSAPPARRRPPSASRTPAIIFGTPCGRGAHAVWGLTPSGGPGRRTPRYWKTSTGRARCYSATAACHVSAHCILGAVFLRACRDWAVTASFQQVSVTLQSVRAFFRFIPFFCCDVKSARSLFIFLLL